MRVAIYSRKSTEQTGVSDEHKSVARQVEGARKFAAEHRWTVLEEHIYADDGVSGAEFANRPGFLRLMNALKPRPPFDVLIMSEESRLGREAIETAYALKQLVQAGVRVFFFHDGRERTLETATDKLLMSVTAFADELEREKARQRTYDAMAAKARAGHVTGGRVFGYDNVEVLGEPDSTGRKHRQRVERRINEVEAAVVRRIFDLCASGNGYSRIAKLLNEEGERSPRPQQGRPAGWAPSSIHEVLKRPLYRGEIVWNRTRKRDRWGRHKASPRPASEWLLKKAPELRIVPEETWQAVATRLGGIRERLERASGGRLGRRARDIDSNYLLPGFARCAICGGGLGVTSRGHGQRRERFYSCVAYQKRGRTVCPNGLSVRMAHVDDAVLRALAGDVLRPSVVMSVIDGVMESLKPEALEESGLTLRAELLAIEAEIAKLTEAIAAGGAMTPLLEALRARQDRRATLVTAIEALTVRQPQAVNRAAIERVVRAQLKEWRALLTKHVQDGRTLLRQVLVGPLKFTPEDRIYRFEGEAAVGRLIAGTAGLAGLPTILASPTGFEPVFQP